MPIKALTNYLFHYIVNIFSGEKMIRNEFAYFYFYFSTLEMKG